jgi:poly-gamma-glutamate synthesis protein (capsule biosynthesis protein)
MPSPYNKWETLKLFSKYFFPSMKRYHCFTPCGSEELLNNYLQPTQRIIFFGDMCALNYGVMPVVCSELKMLMSKADLIVGNCESPIRYESVVNTWSSIKLGINQNYLINLLEELGISHQKLILNIANNHAYDFLEEGINTTIEILNGLEIKSFGYFKNEEEMDGIHIELGCIKLLLIGWTDWINCPLNNTLTHLYKFPHAIDILQKYDNNNSTLKICFPHWGYEFEHFPRLEQIDRARKLTALGANLIIGHHSHVIQPVENINGNLCFYNLGNFTFDMYAWPTRIIPVLELMVGNTEIKETKISSYRLHFFLKVYEKNKALIIPLNYFNAQYGYKYKKRLNRIVPRV